MCKHREQCWTLENRFRITVIFGKKTCFVYSERFPRGTIITPNCQLFGGTTIQVGWHTSQEQFGSHHESPSCWRQLQGTKTINSYGDAAAYHCAPQKTPVNTSAEALSFLLQLLDRPFFRIKASGVPRHYGVTPVAPSGNWVFFGRNNANISIMSTSFHSALVVCPHH